MKPNKDIERNTESGVKIFNNRSLDVDYRTLRPMLHEGMTVLDVGCGTGAISKDIANIIGIRGQVIGIDNNEKFIESGYSTYNKIENLKLIHSNLFEFEPVIKFDLIIAARVLQWMSNPLTALIKMKTMLKPKGQISILDYNHDAIEWNPLPPESMKQFYNSFLRWRKEAGMNNQIAEDLPELMNKAGLVSIEKINSDEYYHRGRPDFESKVGIWAKVAGSKQMVEEGYLEEELRIQAIRDYDIWVDEEAISMTMKLNEVRGLKS